MYDILFFIMPEFSNTIVTHTHTHTRTHTHTHTHICIYIYIYTSPLAYWVEGLPMACETGIQSQVESYKRLKKWYLIPLYLTLSIIRHVLRVKCSNTGKGVMPSPIPHVVAIEKRAFGSPLIIVINFSTTYIYAWIQIWFQS